MKLPTSASEKLERQDLPDENEAVFINPYHGREKLTKHEAIDCINILSGELLADGHFRSETEDQGGVRQD